MFRTLVDERSSLVELLAPHSVRRRRRPVIEGQSPRCPLCERVMVVRMERGGPRYRCGCDEDQRS
jgi:hypothetical protein